MSKGILEQFIDKHDWFRDMFRNMPEDIRLHWKVRNYNIGDQVCGQDTEVTHFYILVTGELAVERQLSDGKAYTLSTMQPGFVVGDIEISLNTPFINRVYAFQQSTLLLIETKIYKNWVMNDPYFLRRINYQLAKKLYVVGQKMISSNFHTVRKKILVYFYEFIQSFCSTVQDSYVLVASREDIAKHLGVSVRSINRVIKDLKDEKIVSVRHKRLIFNEYSVKQIAQELAE
ncbi:Crp/Fnr family transcriptional regulator [Cytobacillus purgationiresistens]|uniref:CRP-like cAMP-binding protein n=1 Tax=Cytobacillus purgationiresistens TaxID=863449 RepID=A0ABU0AN10_9BACI|nr:Crp/Fnr family transcriptional regulator [Cytobacillus purgationiresistens]MDQ0272182.1 CRP-like cAMP-binding protein [Cytobacillus purgationiresistens]